MNNKGQSLVVFILTLPLLLILGAFIVDNAYMTYKNIELRNVSKDIIKIDLKERKLSDEEIKKIYDKNNIPTKDLKIKKEENKISLDNQYYIDSIFGKIIGFKSYEVSASITGELKDNKIVFK